MRRAVYLGLLWTAGCASAAAPGPASAPASQPTDALAEVARVHGGVGPFAVAGYRMTEHAMAQLGLRRHSFDLEVVHYTPPEVQFSCIADGASAASGVSVGKLDLRLVEVPRADTRTSYRRRSDGRTIVLRLAPDFVARYLDLPRDRLAAAGAEVLALADDEIFETVE